MKLDRGDHSNGYRPFSVMSAVKNLVDGIPRGVLVPVEVDDGDPLGVPDNQQIRMTLHKLSVEHGFKYSTRMISGVLHILVRC